MGSIPEPHPLDFDWRFDSKTVAELSDLVYNGEPVLAVGCPSLAQHFNRTGREAVLVDRQPFQCNKTQIVRDVNLGGARVPGFLTAIVDPPWYPEQVSTWIAWAANCVGAGGTVYASIWPNETRPSGETEYLTVRRWMESWSTVVQLDYQPTYEKPLFESIAQRASQSDDMAKSPRVGRLLEIKVQVVPSLPMVPSSNEKWLRFVINDYQIAIRMRDDEITLPSILQVSGADGWKWPFVSRRAPERSQIDVWSSQNEVGKIRGSKLLAETIRTATKARNDLEFESAFSKFPSLLQWNIPRPPFWRIHEWSHHQ